MGSAAPLAGAASRPLLLQQRREEPPRYYQPAEGGNRQGRRGAREPLRSPRCCCGARTAAAAATAHSAMLPPPACGSCQGACAAEPAEEWPGSLSSPFYPTSFRRVPHIRRERKSGKGFLRSWRLSGYLPSLPLPPFLAGQKRRRRRQWRLPQVAIAASG